MVDPVEAPARGDVLDSLAQALVRVESAAVIASPREPSIYGLGEEASEVFFVMDGARHRMRIGGPTPVGANTYVATEEDGEIFVVPSQRLVRFAQGSLEGLRDGRVLAFDAPDVHRVTISGADSRAVVLERDAEGWKIVSPIEAAADPGEVGGLLSTLSFLRAMAFIDRPDASQVAAAETPETEIVLEWGNSESPRRSRLAIAATAGGRGRLVRGDRDALFEVEAERLFELPRALDDFRKKQLAGFDPREVAFYEAVFRPRSGGAITVGMERSSEGWEPMTPESMIAGAPSRAISALANLQASEIVAEEAGPAEWVGLGLKPAAVTYRVYGAPGDDGRPRPLAEVHFGHRDSAQGIIARRPGDSRVYRVAAGVGRHMPLDYGAFLEEFRSREEEAAPSEP
ncbi:MAG: DUF4340 domain-containing protein [Myxococcota bacterium]|nr:DUF4340 domain-containing protein [Myxococcota bacterium]